MQPCSSPACERNSIHPSKPGSSTEPLLVPSTRPSHTHSPYFLGAWGQAQSLPWKRGSSGGEDKGAPITTQGGPALAGELWDGGRCRRPDGQRHRAWPQLPRLSLHTICPRQGPASSLPPSPQGHHRGLSNHKSDSVLPSLEPLFTFAGPVPHTIFSNPGPSGRLPQRRVARRRRAGPPSTR